LAENLFFENEVNRQNQEEESYGVIDFEGFVFEKHHRKDGEYHQGNDFLDDFELPEVEWAAVFGKTDAVCRNLKAIFKQGDAPTDQDDAYKTQILAPTHLLEFQMAIPGKGHKGV